MESEFQASSKTSSTAGGPAPPGFFHELVERNARRDPDAPAVTGGGRTLSFGDLDGAANRLAGHLASIGVTPGSRVGVGLDRSPESLVAQLAAFKLGAAAVLLDSSYPAQRLEFMLTDSAAAALVTSTGLAGRFPAPCPVVRYDSDAWWDPARTTQPARTAQRARVDDDTVCHVAYTSGSTGVPKAVLLRHGPLRNTLHVLREQCAITAGDRGSWLCSPGFGLVEVDCFPLLAAGASVYIPEPDVLASPERLLDWIVGERLTQSLVLTAMAERLWGLRWPASTPLRIMRIAGERARSWPPAALPFEVLNVYGSAEATVVATCELKATAAAFTDGPAGRLPPIGRPVANVRTYVLGDGLQPVPAGEIGELYVSGASLSAGYLNRPDVEDAKFLPNPLPGDPYPVLYRSGDLARSWPDGTLEVIGRVDDEVKIRGYRVHLGEVESALAGLPGVRQCAVLAGESGDGDRRLVGYVEPVPGAPPSVSGLRQAMERALPDHLVPSAFLVGDLPTTPNGKIDRAALPDPPRTRPDLDSPYVEPSSPAERLLAGLFERALDVEGIGAGDSFFELGGDSLRAMRLLDRLRREHGVEVGLAQLYEAPTVTALAALAGRVGQPDVPAAPGEPLPLTAAQRALLAAGGDAVDYFEWDRDWLDADRFRLAWRRLLGRHDALRTVLSPGAVLSPDVTTQRVLPMPRDDVIVTDLRAVAEPAPRLGAIRAEAISRVAGPAAMPHELRLTLLPDEQVRIHLWLSGCAVDPAGAQLLLAELAELYEDPDRTLPPPLHRSAARSQGDGSSTVLADMVPAPRKPEPSPPEPSPPEPSQANTLTARLEPSLWTDLVRQAEHCGVSPGNALVAAFAAAIGAATGTEQVTFRLRTFDRGAGERLVGAFDVIREVEVSTAGSITESARRLAAELPAGRTPERPAAPPSPILVTNLLDLGQGAGTGSLGDAVIRHSRYPGVVLELRILAVDGVPHLDLYGAERSALGQSSALLQDHLRLIDWFAGGEPAYRKLEEERGCEPPSPCR